MYKIWQPALLILLSNH